MAYNLANFLRTRALPVEVEQSSMTTRRDRLVKIGSKIVRHTRSITFQMADVMVPRGLFEKILASAPSIAAGTLLSINTMAAASSCRRTGPPEGGCSGLKAWPR